MSKIYIMPKFQYMPTLIKSPAFRFSFFVAILFVTISSAYPARIVELNINGPIGPATVDYIVRNIDKAQQAELILITLDTPGGLYESTRIIIQRFLSSKVPIVTYVSPRGARAASAGTFLMYASTIAAMAPGTQLGAASPVNLNEIGFENEEDHKKKSTMNEKITNDALATLRTLAQLRGRDPIFAQKAVLNASSITSIEALHKGVINYIAVDKKDLLVQLNAKTVVQNDRTVILNTSAPQIEVVNPDWRTRFLSMITEPTLTYLLLLLGIYGIFFELLNPGHFVSGIIGVISLCVALYALQLLPINYAAFFLIVLGICFIIAEAFLPSFGALGIGGTIAFVIGSIMLFDTNNPLYQIAWPVIAAMAVVNIVIFVSILSAALKARKQQVRHGLAVLVGAKGRTLGDINKEGQAIIRGEIWSVRSEQFIAANKPIKVINSSGFILDIKEDGNQQGE